MAIDVGVGKVSKAEKKSRKILEQKSQVVEAWGSDYFTEQPVYLRVNGYGGAGAVSLSVEQAREVRRLLGEAIKTSTKGAAAEAKRAKKAAAKVLKKGNK